MSVTGHVALGPRAGGFGSNHYSDRPPTLPTEERTTDVEAWREKMESRRGKVAQRERLDRAALASQVAASMYREPSEPEIDVDVDDPEVEVEVDVEPEPVVVPVPRPPTVRAPEVDPATARRLAMVTAYVAGDSIRSIADAHGLATSTVRKYLLDAGVELRPWGVHGAPAQAYAAAKPPSAPPAAPSAPAPLSTPVPAEPAAAVVDEPEPAATPAPAADPFGGRRVNGAQVVRDRLVAAGVTAAQLRQWARAQGRTVSSHGAPPAALLDDYLADHVPASTLDLQALADANPGIGGGTVEPAVLANALAADPDRWTRPAGVWDGPAQRPAREDRPASGEMTDAEWLVDRVWTAGSWHEAVQIVEGAFSGHAAALAATAARASVPAPGVAGDLAAVLPGIAPGAPDVVDVAAALTDAIAGAVQMVEGYRAFVVARLRAARAGVDVMLAALGEQP